jgi:hypothetical protein
MSNNANFMKNQYHFYKIFTFFIPLFIHAWYISIIAGYSGRKIAMEYTTWYEFKRDCENILGHSLLNETWLKVKPSNPLPWNDTDVVSVLLAVGHLSKMAEHVKLEARVRR